MYVLFAAQERFSSIAFVYVSFGFSTFSLGWAFKILASEAVEFTSEAQHPFFNLFQVFRICVGIVLTLFAYAIFASSYQLIVWVALTFMFLGHLLIIRALSSEQALYAQIVLAGVCLFTGIHDSSKKQQWATIIWHSVCVVLFVAVSFAGSLPRHETLKRLEISIPIGSCLLIMFWILFVIRIRRWPEEEKQGVKSFRRTMSLRSITTMTRRREFSSHGRSPISPMSSMSDLELQPVV